jgi:hypothetical protein
MPQTLSDCPCDLFIDIANASRTGNCNCLKLNGMSFGIIGMRGIKTSSPLYFPFKIVASITLFINFFTASRVPLQRRDWFMFRTYTQHIGEIDADISRCDCPHFAEPSVIFIYSKTSIRRTRRDQDIVGS